MGWSLSRRGAREPELLDALFLSAGRALYLSNAFEGKCTFVLRIGKMVEAFQTEPPNTLEELFATAPPDKMLGGTLKDLADFERLATPEENSALSRAREARNFIAHEGAAVGLISCADSEEILARVVLLRAAVADLAVGDNIVSRWICSIEEPESRVPVEFADAYPGMVDKWVFGHFDELAELPRPKVEITQHEAIRI